MRFAVVATALLSAAIVRADVADDLKDASSSVSSAVESATSSVVEKPTFTVRACYVAHRKLRNVPANIFTTAHHPQSPIPRTVHR